MRTFKMWSILCLAAALSAVSCSNLLVEATSADQRFVEQDAQVLEPELAAGDSSSVVTTSFTLPSENEEGSSITWTSSNPAVIAIDGTVTRPAFVEGPATVTLTAVITFGTATSTRTYTYTVAAVDPTDAEAVAAAKAALAITYAAGDSAARVIQNVTLASTGLYGTAVSWSSSAPGVVANSGAVTRPAFASGDALVTLTATISRNATSDPRTFSLTVKESPGIYFSGNGSDGGAAVASQALATGASVNLPACTWTKTGNDFAGWNTAADRSGSAYAAGSSYEMTSEVSVTLYAGWTAGDYNLSYNGNGSDGGTAPSTTAVEYDTSATVASPSSLSRSHYTFVDWDTVADGTGTDYDPGHTFTMPAHDVTLYAQWTPVMYSITYNLDGGTNGANPASYTIVTATINLASATKAGSAFGGWYDNAGFTGSAITQIASGSSGNRTLYAKFVPVYTVAYVSSGQTGGSVPASQTKTHGVDLTLATNGTLVKTGYYIANWNTASDGSGTGYAPGGTYNADSSVTLYAQWALQPYYITYYGLNGGETHSNPTVYYINSGTITLTAPTARADNTFIAWVSNDTGIKVVDPNLDIFNRNNKVLTIPAGSTGDRALYTWYEPIPRLMTIYLDPGSASGYYSATQAINVGDQIRIYTNVPLDASTVQWNLVRGSTDWVQMGSRIGIGDGVWTTSMGEFYSAGSNLGYFSADGTFDFEYGGSCPTEWKAQLHGNGSFLTYICTHNNMPSNEAGEIYSTAGTGTIWVAASSLWVSEGGQTFQNGYQVSVRNTSGNNW